MVYRHSIIPFVLLILTGCSDTSTKQADQTNISIKTEEDRNQIEDLKSQLDSKEQKTSELGDKIRELTSENAKYLQLNEESLRLAKNAQLQLVEYKEQIKHSQEPSQEQRSALRKWLAERDVFRRKILLLKNKDLINAIDNRVASMCKLAFEEDYYQLAVAMLEENKYLRQRFREKKVRDSFIRFGNVAARVGFADMGLKETDMDLVDIEMKFEQILPND